MCVCRCIIIRLLQIFVKSIKLLFLEKMSRLLDAKVYVGDISRHMAEKDLERAFGEYGRIRSVWIATDPPGFGFVQFEDDRDAEDAVHALDGR